MCSNGAVFAPLMTQSHGVQLIRQTGKQKQVSWKEGGSRIRETIWEKHDPEEKAREM